MTKPIIGKRNTRRHQRSLWEGGRFDFNTSTTDNVSSATVINNARRTEDDNIENEDNEPDDSTTAAVFPGIAVGGCCDRLLGHGEREEAELKDGIEGELKHCCSYRRDCDCCCYGIVNKI